MVPTLALDTGLKTGWAWSNGTRIDSGLWILDAAGSEHAGQPLARLERKILALRELLPFDRLVFEQENFVGHRLDTSAALNRMRGVMLLCAAKLGIAWQSYDTSTIKAFAGSGRYRKPQMIAAYKRFYGVEVRSHDECDALWLLQLDMHRQRNPLTQAQAEAKKPKAVKARRKRERKLF